jgi:hypothetical protein
MVHPANLPLDVSPQTRHAKSGLVLLASSIILQIIFALFLGHAYDMRIFMATGY